MSPRPTTRWPDIYARMARISSEALSNEDKAIELWQRVLDIRGEDAQPLQALAEAVHAPRSAGKSWSRSSSGRSPSRPTIRADPPLQALVGSGRRSCSASATHSMRGSAADRIDGNDLETLRASGPPVSLHAGMGRVVPDAAPDHRGRSDDRRESPRRRRSSCTHSIGQLEGDVLGRVDDAVAAWRHVIAIDRATCARWRPSRSVHA